MSHKIIQQNARQLALNDVDYFAAAASFTSGHGDRNVPSGPGVWRCATKHASQREAA